MFRSKRHRHIWKVLSSETHPSVLDQTHGQFNYKGGFGLVSLEQLNRRDVVVTRKCEICGTEEVKRI